MNKQDREKTTTPTVKDYIDMIHRKVDDEIKDLKRENEHMKGLLARRAMKAVACALLCVSLHAETHWQKWTRRALEAANCIVQVQDAWTSARMAPGIVETNTLFRGHSGRMIGFKVGMCAAPLALEFTRYHEAAWSAAPLAGVGAFVVLHNRGVDKKVKP